MSSESIVWPLADKPQLKARVILATQGIRLWTSDCRLEQFDGNLHLSCSDKTIQKNLLGQSRVAFTILNEHGTSVYGSGLARVIMDKNGDTLFQVEPYRVVSNNITYEVRINGWQEVDSPSAADTRQIVFWKQAFRVVTLPLSAIPVLFGAGAAFAQGHFNILILVLALLGAMLVHAGANAVADYFDFKKGVDLSRALSSHLGALAREEVEPEKILLASFACFIITALIGLVLVVLVGWQLLWFGLAGLLGAFFYTGRPFSYKYRGMGELMLGILMGPLIVMGTYFVLTKGWDWSVFTASLALAMLVSSASLANNIRDIPDDRAAVITTLPMVLGIPASKKLYYWLIAGTYPMIAVAIVLETAFWPLALVIFSVLVAYRAIRALQNTADSEADIRQKSLRNPFPLNSIKLHSLFGSLAVAGMIIAGIIHYFG